MNNIDMAGTYTFSHRLRSDSRIIYTAETLFNGKYGEGDDDQHCEECLSKAMKHSRAYKF
ncbi:MAG TPA: hypothetical protein DCZ94_05750 [Lentisphaeria bacterium]|nr:MAG: hypothetical protein A2X48_07270 [Lentisphaerae bacterium GWF2_49_21]HBC86439.1 hypothetical protein [Lentisphaeria bacterium]